ncbi:hypothetical protein H0H87_008246 [Tephrocybe sp. NHM501043]|nr:hypothetical protein H0H87_008246 [Tephrocybe sp. NHM501043]
MVASSSSLLTKPQIQDSLSDHADVESEQRDGQIFERRTMRTVDLRLLPLLGLLYALALIDRSNLGVARIAGMDHDLLMDFDQGGILPRHGLYHHNMVSPLQPHYRCLTELVIVWQGMCDTKYRHGAITIFFGIIAWFYISEFPDENTFLTHEQTVLVLARVERDRGDSIPDEMTGRKLTRHLLDWKLWVYGESDILIYPS